MQPPPDENRLRRQAQALLQAGRLAEAHEAYARLVHAGCMKGDDWYNLGWLRHRLGESAAAFEAYGLALQHGADGVPEILLNRSVLLAENLGRPQQALQETERALALDPAYLPAWLNLGNLHEQLGRRDEARGAYAEALRRSPGHALALARASALARDDDEREDAVRSLRDALGPGRGSPAERADLGFALARLLDALGRHDEAFEALKHAHGEAGRLARTRYDPAAHERWVDHLIASFDRPLAASWPEPLAETSGLRPIFICGLLRSGSSLTEQILGSHPEVTTAGEFPALPRLARLPPTGWTPQAVRAVQLAYLQAAREAFPQARVLTDKRMENFLHIGLILAAWPAARIVHPCRDPLDTGLAVYFLHLDDSMPWARSLEHIGHWQRQHHRLMAHWHRVHGDAIVDLRYESLVREPEPAIRALLAHCGLAWHPRCLQPHETPSQVRTPSTWQVREPIHARSAGRAARYLAHLGPLQRALTP